MVFDTKVRDLLLRWEQLLGQGRELSAEEFCAQEGCPEFTQEVARGIQVLKSMKRNFECPLGSGDGAERSQQDSQQAANDSSFESTVIEPQQQEATCRTPGGVPHAHRAGRDAEIPKSIGRYEIQRLLGSGAFGRVYLAYDSKLKRRVAIKVPHPELLGVAEDINTFLSEAQILASLDHANIVTVHDFGRTDDGCCYVVSQCIEGTDLRSFMKTKRLPFEESAVLTADVAEALHYAHTKRLVHRDIKPANLLIDSNGKPYVTDFGLALKEVDFGRGAYQAGTPAYMSPEQARGEGHLVNGQSDIFSLGVVFYELLTGVRPFHAETQTELLDRIKRAEARPPRQHNDKIPKELERICLKALSKRSQDRYTTAKDMAEDLQHFLSSPEATAQSDVMKWTVGVSAGTEAETAESERIRVKVIPKGLRSFDAHDADFFLELLPGPRDRDGLPDSIRFWKTRIEETDPDETFSVGLIYGPSGCGKTSLVKAGLLPRLSDQVTAVYVEATSDEIETRLLNGLRKRIPALSDKLGLKETLAALRRGRGIPDGQKVLIVLDQFEQWLHANRNGESADLVQALRQCDGRRVQCILMVRDDFWLAVSRFMRELEIHLVDGHNVALADLFDLDHARKVLGAFGRAFNRLPENASDFTTDAKNFLTQAVSELAEDGKVICVRFALFAEMMKGKPWTPATLKEAGGTKGMGVTFLEETFCTSTASPEHRLHEKAARAVLKALLPESGSDIKGQMRSQRELLDASGYANRSADFESLLHILDSELRLISPTESDGDAAESESTGPVTTSGRYYQLTHDYLVHSLRDWLTVKQKETRGGRAMLRLAERAALWNAKRERKQLPLLWEWLSIALFTSRSAWTEPQRCMMRAAQVHHSVRVVVPFLVLLAVLVTSWLSIERQNRKIAENQVFRLLYANAPISDVPELVADMREHRSRAIQLLREHQKEERKKPNDENNYRRELYIAYALLELSENEDELDKLLSELVTSFLDAAPDDVPLIVGKLYPHKDRIQDQLWRAMKVSNPRQLLRAATALAYHHPLDTRWRTVAPRVADALVDDPLGVSHWANHLKPAQPQLSAALEAIVANESDLRSERAAAVLKRWNAQTP